MLSPPLANLLCHHCGRPSSYCRLRVWDMGSWECVHEMSIRPREFDGKFGASDVTSISVSSTGLIAAGTSMGDVWVWQPPDAAPAP